jgi:hypothetical protein
MVDSAIILIIELCCVQVGSGIRGKRLSRILQETERRSCKWLPQPISLFAIA